MTGLRAAAVVAGTFLLLLATAPAPARAGDGVRAAQWHLTTLEVRQAHKISRGQGVVVALLDTGVDAGHRDLAGAVLPGADLFPDPLGDGRNDIDGHGTEMAGIIAGQGHGNAGGVLGIAPGAQILPIRGPINAMATSDYVVRAVSFAGKHGADVINMSFGTGDTEVLRAAVRAALDADMVVVVAAGNRGSPAGEFPGRYPEVLTVGAVGRSGKVADFSVAGPQVDLAAPGVDIVTTGIGESGYYRGSGTSEATAVVSGAAALVRAAHPELGAADVVRRLTGTARDAGTPGRDDRYGYGRLDLLRALTTPVGTTVPRPAATVEAGGGAPSVRNVERVSPLVVTGVAAAGVLLLGAVVVGFLARKRRD